VPKTLVWDNEGSTGQWRGGRPRLPAEANAFRGMLGIAIRQCRPADPEAKGLVERANGYLETSFMPGRAFTGPGDFNAQLTQWLARANTRHHRRIGCRPVDRIEADRAAAPPSPPGRSGGRVADLDTAGPRPLRPGRLQRLLGAPVGDRAAGRGRRRP